MSAIISAGSIMCFGSTLRCEAMSFNRKGSRRFLHSFACTSYIIAYALQYIVQSLLLSFTIGIEVLHHFAEHAFTVYTVHNFIQFAEQGFVLHDVERINLVAILFSVEQIDEVDDETIFSW